MRLRYWIHEWSTVKCFYHSASFRHIDLALRKAYFLKNPYRTCRKFLEKQGEQDPYQYGETPIPTMSILAERFGIVPGSYVYELGSGRGRCAFFLSAYLQCRVVGIDKVPAFILTANRLASYHRLPVTFLCKDFSTLELHPSMDFVYLYGTCLSETVIRTMVEQWKQVRCRAGIITVSYPLSDYSSCFAVEKKCLVEYLWGTTTAYLNRII